MQQIYTTVFQLLKYSLYPQLNMNQSVEDTNKTADDEKSADSDSVCFSSGIDWDAVLKELVNHTIVGLPAEFVVRNSDIPAEVKSHWTNIAYGQVGKWTKLMTEQQKLIQLLRDNGIELAIIKGSVAAINYPKPEYRAMGDVDFFVKQDDFEKTYQLMLENGFVFSKGENYGKLQSERQRYHHVGLKKNGVVFELHKKMSEKVQDDEMNRKFQTFIDEGFDNLETGTIDNFHFPMFEKKINGLIYIRHIIQHIAESSGVGLRQLIDWMMFVERYVDDDYWNDEFKTAVSQIGLEDAAKVFARICQLYLGLSEENRSWCENVDETLCVNWMEQIIQMGNFGQISRKKNEGENVWFKNKNIFSVIKSLQKNGLRNWRLARKYSFFAPFAWFYQVCRYVRKGLGRKKPIQSIRKDMEKSKNKKRLIYALNIRGCTITNK